MRKKLSPVNGLIIVLVAGVLNASVWASETIEMATYVPAPSSGGNPFDRLHANRATIGSPYSLTNPAEPNPTDGILLVSDRVGIGTADPQQKLSIVSSSPSALLAGLQNTNPNTGAGTSVEWRIGEGLANNDRYIGVGYFNSGSTPGGFQLPNIGYMVTTAGASNGLVIGTMANAPIRFVTNATAASPGSGEKMRIAGDGNVGIGVTNPGVKFDVAQSTAIRLGNAYISSGTAANANFASNAWSNGVTWQIPNATQRSGLVQLANDVFTVYRTQTAGLSNWQSLLIVNSNGNGRVTITHPPVASTETLFHVTCPSVGNPAGTNLIFCDVGGATRFAVRANGSVCSTGGFVACSDIRLKKNVHPVPDALERICLLRGVNFHWAKEGYDPGLQMGLVGQEVEKVFPELVTTDPDGVKFLAYAPLTGALVEAIKELKERNGLLEKETVELRQELKSLRQEIGTLKGNQQAH